MRKNNLIKTYNEKKFPYFSMDNEATRNSALNDPTGFIHRIDCAVIDEVQHVPELLRAIKVSIDNDRRPGRFLLTGSSNILALPRIADSLAGRMEILTLLPLSNAELHRRKSFFLESALNGNWPHLSPPQNQKEISAQVIKGGYPEMLLRPTAERRFAWARAYLKALLEYDVKELAEIHKLSKMPRLFAILASLSGQQVNFSQIGGQLYLDSKTVQKYIGILENIFLVKRIFPWHHNELGRLIKTPKLHFLDSGLQACMVRLTEEHAFFDRAKYGATLETWVYSELAKSISIAVDPWEIFYYRDKDQIEVDFILERIDRQIIGIEVKASASVSERDFRGLKKVGALSANLWIGGIVLYDGNEVLSFGEKLWAIPLWML